MVAKKIGLSRDFIIHPGETLKDIIDDREMSQKELAARCGVTEKHISTIVNCEKPISIAFAKKLEYALGIDSSFWINLQANYDKELLEYKEINEISKEEIDILKQLKDIIKYLVKFNFLEDKLSEVSKIVELRKILRVSNLTNILNVSYNAAYRARTNCTVNPYVLFAWQRICELRTEQIKISQELNIEKLKNKVYEIKNIMNNSQNFQKDLEKLFAECGIAFCVIRNFTGAPVQGFIKQTEDKKIILCVTIRGAYADIFWFTVFHEIAHIINGDIKQKFIDFTTIDSEIEEKADNVASNMIIDKKDYKEFTNKEDFSVTSIINFSKKQNIPPYMLIGRLQKEKYIPYTKLNNYKLKYEWKEKI